MRFLKNKIFLANQALDRQNSLLSPSALNPAHKPPLPSQSPPQSDSKSKNSPSNKTPQDSASYSQASLKGDLRPTKNIVVNYGKAITSFALSELAAPYLKPFLEQEQIKSVEFIQFAKKARQRITGIEGFRSVILINPAKDGAKNTACKRILIKAGEIFIKYFSVNWIIHGRLAHKLTYLKYRFKVLRRLQNPALFTYMSNEKKKDK